MDLEQQVDNVDTAPSQDSTSDESNSALQGLNEAIADLDKVQKVKFQGQEWTPKDLEKAILRQKDYTRKTQELSQQRTSFEENKKYYVNLAADLRTLEKNPNLVSEFVKLYPKEFHPYAQEALSKTSNTQTQQQPQLDVETQSRLASLEKFYHEQEVQKNEVVINQSIDAGLKKYPDAIPELVIARVYEKYNLSGEGPTKEDWDKTFKEVNDQVTSLWKNKYSEFVKKQTSANAKARDVDAGGGTVGRAPEKFKSLKDVTNFAVKDLTRKG
jgi:hypothetical protein